MSDPFRDFFERDYLAATDFARLYGVNREISLRISQFGMRETRVMGGKRGEPTKVPKPVIFFVEHPNQPMFLNRRAFETLLDRFGDGYWLNENRSRILYAPQRLLAEEDRGGQDGVQFIVHFHRGPYRDHTAPIGKVNADKITAALTPLGWTRDKFRFWIKQEHPDLIRILDAFEDLAEFPFLMVDIFVQWRMEVEADRSRPKPPVPTTTPARKDDGLDRSGGFMPPADENTITRDDIPF